MIAPPVLPIFVAVGCVVVAGTVLYYFMTDEKEKPMGTRSRPSDRSSSTRPSSPPTSYRDIKLSPNPKNIPKKGSPKKNISEPATCRAGCGEPANATFYPCKHKEFCLEHAEYFFEIFRKEGREPKCPIDTCRVVLEYFTG